MIMPTSDFLASLEAITTRAANRSARENASRENAADPFYWVAENIKAHDPKSRSFDILAPFIAC